MPSALQFYFVHVVGIDNPDKYEALAVAQYVEYLKEAHAYLVTATSKTFQLILDATKWPTKNWPNRQKRLLIE